MSGFPYASTTRGRRYAVRTNQEDILGRFLHGSILLGVIDLESPAEVRVAKSSCLSWKTAQQGSDGRQHIVVTSTGGSFLDDPITDDSVTAYALPR